MKQVVEIATKQVVEFGRPTTLYRAIDAQDPKCSTLWHSTAEKALEHWARKRTHRG